MIQRAASYILISCGHGNTGYSTPFIGLHQADMEIAETAKNGLRTVQHFMKSLKDEGEPSSLREKRKNVVVIGGHFLVKSSVQLKAMFNSVRKSISTCSRELEDLGLNNCIVVRKQVILEANHYKICI